MNRLTAHELIDLTFDPDSWESWDSSVRQSMARGAYTDELAAARERTGLDESVMTGSATVRGRRVAVLICEFGFLAGSIGVAAGGRLVDAIERATREALPLVALPVSGGTRMQEGTTAFLQMVKITAAVTAHKEAHLPYLVYLRNPTTGGVFASWGSLGHVTIAEPGALIGFLGPRVYKTLYGVAFPPGVQTAENLHAHGLVDAVCSPDKLAETLDVLLRVLTSRPTLDERGLALPNVSDPATPAWETVLASRRSGRPGVRELLGHSASDMVLLNGTGQSQQSPALILALVRFGDISCVLLGQDRRAQTGQQSFGPASLRQARRGINLARELDLPLVTVIDTPGANLSREAEEGGLSNQIAKCLAELLALRTPTVSLLLGQGAGGGALALLPADRILAAQHSWLSPLPPEGASAIIYRDIVHAPEMVSAQNIRSADLLADGIVHAVIPEYPDAADEPDQFCERVGQSLRAALVSSLRETSEQRLSGRLTHFSRIGESPVAVPM